MRKVMLYGIEGYRMDGYSFVNGEESGYRIFQEVIKARADVCVIHQSRLMGYYPLIQMILETKRIILIYVSFNIEYGNLYNYLDNEYFHVLSDKNIKSIMNSVFIMEKYIEKLKVLNSKVSRLEEKISEDTLVRKAKVMLMKSGLSEEESYSHILKLAMDMRVSKGYVSKMIIDKKILR